jgi:spore coat polysaccharide biosynthesis protein SpsF
MSSHRLPNKVLADLGGRPLLAYTVERLQRCTAISGITIATSDHPEDEPVAALAARLGVRTTRGPLDDVLARFIAAARAATAEAVVRVSGDSPLIDPAVVDRVVARFQDGGCDLATNVHPRSFPKGQSVEVITRAALERAAAATTDPEDHEHVTRYFYRHTDVFRIRNVAAPRDLSAVQFSVDTEADLTLVRRMVGAMDRPHWTYGLDELLALRDAIAAPARA